MMPRFLLIIIVSLCFLPPAFAVDWDPFNQMRKDDQNIIIPSGAADVPSIPNDNEWPASDVPQWHEDKDAYTIELPLRMPNDVDTHFITYKYVDGVLKVTAPKKRFKSII